VSDTFYKDVSPLPNPSLVFMVHFMENCLSMSMFRLDLTVRECVVTTTIFFFASLTFVIARCVNA